jgi:intracellular multiplication protein IcmP
MQGSPGQKDTGELEILWIAIGLILLGAAIFVLFRTQILTALLWVKYAELKFISFFVINDAYQGLAVWIDMANPNRVSLHTLNLISTEIGNTIKYPTIVVCCVFIGIIWFKHPESSFRDMEDMNSLSHKLKDAFPAVNIVQGVDLIKTPIDEGPWAMGMTPIEFAKHYKLIYRDQKTEAIVYDPFKAKMIFTEQLGEPWVDVEHLQPHQKALFAIFAAFINYKREEAEKKLEEIARSITPRILKTGKITFDTQVLLKKYAQTKVVETVTQRHAYVRTIFIEMLIQARTSGIVLNSLYLWLKPIDRDLWYTLNNVGRRAVYSEAAAAHAHWLAEKRLGFPIRQPMIDEAVNALDEAIKSRIIREL